MYIIGQEEVDAVKRVIESKQLFRYLGGDASETGRFEAEWAAKIGTKYAVALTSGTAALITGLVGMGVGPGDEVIVPAYTFMATALAPLAVGAVPIIAEVDASLTLDPTDVAYRITPRTKVIIPVHMNGLSSNMDALMAVARQYNVKVLEDACQADGGSYGGKRLGSIGDAGAFSFNHYKIISCGEGGALVTDDETIYHRALVFHDGGSVFRDHASQITTPFFAGMNFRTNEILSAIMRVQLTRLDGMLDAMLTEKRLMIQALSNVGGFTFNPIHDVEGDCGTTLALLFETPERVRAALDGLHEQGVRANTPIDSDRHVYTHWEPVLNQQGAHHPEMDAYKRAAVPVEYTPDMCPNTLDILARTLFLYTDPTREREDLDALTETVMRILSEL